MNMASRPMSELSIHFREKEAPIVFFVFGADQKAAVEQPRWAVTEANIMNVAATRAKRGVLYYWR